MALEAKTPTPEEVKLIYKDTYPLYKLLKSLNFKLTYAIINNMQDVDSDTFNKIMTDTYKLYVKYKNCYKDEEWADLVKETHELSHRYPFDLCKAILVELLEIIEKVYMSKSKLGRS